MKMLYDQQHQEQLSDALFRNPSQAYRGAPFWAWNCALNKDEIVGQIKILKQMGFGGFHMHVRTGLETPYLSEEFMDNIQFCVEQGEQHDMLAWLYDEDRWPSGAAGGLVTQDARFRQRHLLFTPVPYHEDGSFTPEVIVDSSAEAQRTENGTLLACYDVSLNEDGSLAAYRVAKANDEVCGTRWYAYLETALPKGWFNNQTYINTLDKAAMDRFIEITYEAYNKRIGNRFGKTVPAIFTDEPQFAHKIPLKYAAGLEDVFLPWTEDLADTFHKAYGEDLMAHLPELFWNLPNGEASTIRYQFHDHVCERFAQSFADNCGKWCREHGLKLTGHMMEEPTLACQTAALGEAMRSYRGFDQPGIDMLCSRFEYTTAKQAQSAVHQYGCEGMTSELYGVTNWDFDFRGHKLHGDWQAALGVTLRVPHLAWMSMKGEAKRDYPASINYQSPWWHEYSAVEDHFARLNTALTRGKPLVKVAVIHPIESYWLHWGPQDVSDDAKERLDQMFQNVTQWLLFGMVDFDFISESVLPDLCQQGDMPLQVGQMAYDAVVVPGCETLRSSTLERLERFVQTGGRLIFVGNAPKWENAKPSDRGRKLFDIAHQVSADAASLLAALEPARLIEARDADGKRCTNLLYQLRQDHKGLWLFVAHGKEPYNKDVSSCQDVHFKIQGCYQVERYDTQTGRHEAMPCSIVEDHTIIKYQMYDYDSLLLWLTPADTCDAPVVKPHEQRNTKKLSVPSLVRFTLDEPNVLLLDSAQYALDDGVYQPEMELLRADNVCREQLNWPRRQNSFPQPWATPEEPITHRVRLRFTIHSEIEIDEVKLAIEDAEQLVIRCNEEEVPIRIDGWYADRSIQCIVLPHLHQGENMLEVVLPFGRRTNIEWAYLLGDFSVRINGSRLTLCAPVRELGFGDICTQGLPFYGGNLTYRVPFESTGGRVHIKCPHYRGAMLKISVDDDDSINVIYPPYTADFGSLPPGKHEAAITLYGHRGNSFGPVHLADLKEEWIGPDAWRSEGDAWSDSYQLCREGLLSAPLLFETTES